MKNREILRITRYLAAKRQFGKSTAPPTQPFPEFPEYTSFEELHKYSIANHADFWGRVSKSMISWDKEFTITENNDFKSGKVEWFPDGMLNASFNCIDRHLETKGDQTAFIWEGDELDQIEKITYRELHQLVSRIANVLKQANVQVGEPVAIYLPCSIIAAAVMQACARIGAPHTVVFAGFSPGALADRINDSKAKVLITMDGAMRSGKTVHLKKIADEAIAQCPNLTHCFVAGRLGHADNVLTNPIDVNFDSAIAHSSQICDPISVNAEHPLYLLYTSGSTGKPKGLVHTTGGYLTHAVCAHKHAFHVEEGDIFGCVADLGWTVGHTVACYGNLLNGGTSLLFESLPNYPDPGRYWSMVERHKLTQFFSAPTAYRMLMQYDNTWVEKYDRSTLKYIMTAGENCNLAAWEWLHNVVGGGRCKVVDCWWQTETGALMMSPTPSPIDEDPIPSACTRGFYGIDPVLVDEDNIEITENEVKGAFCIRSPWPGLCRTIHNNPDRYFETYFKTYPGMYETGDAAVRDETGRYQIAGRMDDIINIAGHRISTAEIEDCVSAHPATSEAAVISIPHVIKGETTIAFVILKNENKSDDDAEECKQSINDTVGREIAKFAIPANTYIVNSLPKTRSGKVMRRLLRKLATHETDFGDTSTLVDPTVLESIKTTMAKQLPE